MFLLSEKTRDMTPLELVKLQEKVQNMTPEELEDFRNDFDPDLMGFFGEEGAADE